MGGTLLSALAMVVAGLLGVCLSLRAMRQNKDNRGAGRYYALAIGSGILLAAASLVAGGHMERHWHWWTAVNDRVLTQELPFQEFSVRGDPSLRQWVRSQQPQRARPDLSDAAALQSWQAELRRHLRESVFQLADSQDSAPPVMEVLASEELPSGVRRKFVAFESFDGTSIPAYLLEPKDDGRRAAVLVLPGHGDGILETAGFVDSYQHRAALRLAEAGFVAFTPELRGFGYLGARINNEHLFTAYNAILGGSCYKAIILRDIQRAVDLLVSLPNVNPERLAVTGASYGGELSLTCAALDERLHVVVTQAFGQQTGVHDGVAGVDRLDQPHYCHVVPGQNEEFLSEDLYLLVAPRPLLVVETGRQRRTSTQLSELLQTAYKSAGGEHNFVMDEQPGRHEYVIEPAIRFLREHLEPR